MDTYPLLLLHRVKDCFHSAISSLLANLFSALFTFVFALVGTLLGAFTGALIGQETESGFIRGAAVGAISGAVFSIDVLESSLLLWQSDQSGIACLLYLIDVIASLLSGRLVRERIGPAMLSAVQNQMGAVESQFPNQTDIFDTAISNGLTGDSLDRIPKVRITDTSGEMVSCSVCLQDIVRTHTQQQQQLILPPGDTAGLTFFFSHFLSLFASPYYYTMATTESSAADSASAFFPPCDKDKKPVWNKPCMSSSPPLMGADSWPALSPLSSHKSPPSSKGLSDGSSPMPQEAAATSSDYHSVNGQRKPFRRNNSTSSSNPHTNADQNHTQRSGAATTQSRNPHHRHHRNGNSSYPGNRQRNVFEHGHSNGRGDMHLQPQRGFGTMRPQMLMGPPSNAQYMAAAPQIGSYGGPMLYPADYALHVFMRHPPPESIALVGNFPPPPPIYFPSFDPMLSNKILTQVEYYFSADNLSKDEHLRGQMNDDGWVPVRIIAGFRRLAELTDNMQTILEALRSSEVVEIKGEALRRRGDWDKYLLPAASLGAQLEGMTLSERSREGE
uniref:HTH La-type RNA-binding domain-containing protein n=2 Tax=Brassica campestris TaxID=3711 RepID=M4F7X5_BRACM